MIDVANISIRLEGFSRNEKEDISRCLMALYSVREGEQPLDRNFGLNCSFLDKPMPVAKNLFALEVIQKTVKYEKRAVVRKVEYNFDSDGRLVPVIFCERGDAGWA